jgi:hypothetical protein
MQQKSTDKMDQMKDTQELAKKYEEHLVCQPPRGSSARYPRTVHQEEILQPELDPLKVNSTFPLSDLLNQPRDCYQIIGEDEAPLGDAIPSNL